LEVSSFSLAVAHLNHLARGEDSNRDEDFVSNLCQKLGLKIFIDRIDVAKISLNRVASFQETARNIRHAFLNRILSEWRGDLVSLGHNADDQVESFLINILRGSGLLGLTRTPSKKGRYIRPLYGCFRSEIEDYIGLNGLKHCSDVTNLKTHYLRNKIRLGLIPFLKSFNPKIKSSLIETSGLLTDDEDYLQKEVDKIFSKVAINDQESNFPSLRVDLIIKQHPAIQKRLLRQAILQAKGDLRSISSRHIFDVLRLIKHSVSASEIHLPDGLTVFYNDGKLSFRKTNL
ncbi:uncharacterized protein METZ01_LOCUS395492, partial [marine metagenome]